MDPRSPLAGCKGGVPGLEGRGAPPGGTEYFLSIVDISHSLLNWFLFVCDMSPKTETEISRSSNSQHVLGHGRIGSRVCRLPGTREPSTIGTYGETGPMGTCGVNGFK